MRRKPTSAEVKAYADLARAAKKLRLATARAERKRERQQGARK